MAYTIKSSDDGGKAYIENPLGVAVRQEFDEVAALRGPYEQVWLKDLRQYLGHYDPEVLERLTEDQSRLFVPATRKKVRTADARLRDLLFPSGRRGDNWSIAPTEEPTLSLEDEQALMGRLLERIHRARAEAAQAQGIAPEQVPAPSPEEVDRATLDRARSEYAEVKAEAMRSRLNDQLGEMQYPHLGEQVIHSGNLYGIGILKGPLPERRVVTGYHYDEARGWVMSSREENHPYAEFVPLWSAYPDMAARGEVRAARFFFQEHVMPRHAVLALAKEDGFDGEAILAHVTAEPEGDAEERPHETELRRIHDAADEGAQAPSFKGYYRLMQRWGWLSVEDVEGIEDLLEGEIPEGAHEVFCNVWCLGSCVVKARIETGYRHLGDLFHFFYCERGDGGLLDAQGWPRIIRDDQVMLNASTRAVLDNAKATAGPAGVELDLGLLEYHDTPENKPWKPYYRKSSAAQYARNAVTFHELGNYTSQFGEIIGLAERWLHEHSLPAYMEGQNNPHAGGAADTASGLSMLMTAANIELKDLARNFDDVTESFITALYHWNMTWSEDESIKGDFRVFARGSSALMAKEVKAQMTGQYLTLMKGREAWIKDDEIVQTIAEVTEHKSATKTKAEYDRDRRNQPPSLEEREAQREDLKAAADYEKAKAHADKSRAEVVERLAELIATSPDPAALVTLAQTVGIDLHDDEPGAGQAGPAGAGQPAIPARPA